MGVRPNCAFAAVLLALCGGLLAAAEPDATAGGQAASAVDPQPFGERFAAVDGWATGRWWEKPAKGRPFPLEVPAAEKIAFAIYCVDVRPNGTATLKLTTQLFPLRPDEPRRARLEVRRHGRWEELATADVRYPGWSAHFRVDAWDATAEHAYRVRHGETAEFAGTIRRDPAEKDELVVAVLSCNSSRTPGQRRRLVDGLRRADPDLLFFAGDQTYRHTQHTVGWIEFGLQFRDILRDRPAVTIPDDHDVGQANLWGNGGGRASDPSGASGGYFYPTEYVNMVQRQQTWHLPDPVDPEPIRGGIGVYFTRLILGGLDFAILEDRKFKTGPAGTIPRMGPRPDHITDPAYDRAAIDLPDLELLGQRQLEWLRRWANDSKGVRGKCVLSQTAFCGAVHMHGGRNSRLLADLDCNGWPQSQRNAALRLIRQAHAVHLCGDQHLAVVVQHGIDEFRDGPYAFTAPALVNTIYGRWWHPADEQPGPAAVENSPLPWTGDYRDGLGNRITMLAYANPEAIGDETRRGDGYGIARFNFTDATVTFECWPRFPRLDDEGRPRQYPGWPVVVPLEKPPGPR